MDHSTDAESGKLDRPPLNASANGQPDPAAPSGASSDSAEPTDDFTETGERNGRPRAWRIPLRWKWEALAISCLGLTIGALTAFLQTPKYLASAGVEVEGLSDVKGPDQMNRSEKSFPGNGKAAKPVAPSAVAGSLVDFQTKVRALESRALVASALAKLSGSRAEIDAWRPELSGWREFERSPSDGLEWHKLSADTAGPDVLVRTVPMTRDIEVSVSSANARFAAALANEICDEFVQESIEARWNISRQTGEWLDELIEESRGRLAESDAAAREYARKAGLPAEPEGAAAALNPKLRAVAEALGNARTEREAKQSELDLAKKGGENGPEILEDPALTQYEAKLAGLKKEAARSGGDVRVLQGMKARIASLEDTIRVEGGAAVERLRNEYVAAARRETLLQADYASQARRSGRAARLDKRYDSLEHDVEENRKAYDALLERAQEMNLDVRQRTGNIRFLDAAKPPVVPYKPSLIFNAGVGLFWGLVGAAIWLLARQRLDSTIRYPGDSAWVLEIPELGVIPHRAAKPVRRAASLSALNSGTDASFGTDETSGSSSDAAKVADSFRGVLTSLLFAQGEKRDTTIITVTSASAGEGRTTVTTNLGIAFAEVRSRVLLIDGHGGLGGLSGLFEVAEKPGLGELLQAAKNNDALSLVQKTRIDGLSILGSGPHIQSRAMLLHSDRFAAMLNGFRKQYDVILIDTPPVLTTPDARIFGRASDGVLLVARSGQTRRQMALAAAERLLGDGSVLVGTVLNDWDARKNPEYRFRAQDDRTSGVERQKPLETPVSG